MSIFTFGSWSWCQGMINACAFFQKQKSPTQTVNPLIFMLFFFHSTLHPNRYDDTNQFSYSFFFFFSKLIWRTYSIEKNICERNEIWNLHGKLFDDLVNNCKGNRSLCSHKKRFEKIVCCIVQVDICSYYHFRMLCEID